MFNHISGTVYSADLNRAVIDAGGVGYELLCSASTLRQLCAGQPALLLTHFTIGQDGVALYGFYSEDERDMFRRLISVNRVGPKLALSVLSALTPADVAGAILTQNTAALSKVPGMGKKTAERVLLELKESVAGTSFAASVSSGGEETVSMRAEVIEALVGMGYDGVAAGRAVAAAGERDKIEDMIRAALNEIAKG